MDALCWSHYYAGRVFLETKSWPPDLHLTKERVYVVIEEAGNPHPRLEKVAAARQLAAHGKEVYRWEGRRGNKEALVLVYRIDR